MKRLMTPAALILLAFQVIAQNNINWQKIDSNKDKYNFEYFIRTGNNAYDAVFTIPHNKPFQATKHSIFIRNYDKNMVQLSEKGIPAESPLTVYVAGYRNYNVFAGSMDDNYNPLGQMAKEEKVLIADENMNPLIEKTFLTHGKKNRFDGLPSLFTSPDSTFLIVVVAETVMPNMPGMKQQPRTYYVNVYDQFMKMVWNDSIEVAKVFGENASLDDVSFNYINNKLLLAGSVDKAAFSKAPAKLYLLEFDKPQSYKMIVNENCPYNMISFETYYAKKGRVYMSGINHNDLNEGTMGIYPKRKLFYIAADINAGSSPVVKYYEMDKDFTSKYPEYKQKLMESFRYPTQLLLINDNLYYICEHRYTSTTTSSTSSSTTNHFNHITLIKFDTDGQIVWLKMIMKNVSTKQIESSGVCHAFRSGNDICLFYYNYIDDVTSEKVLPKIRIIDDDKLWITRSVIDTDGEIHSKVISNVGDNRLITNLSKIIQLSDTRFMMIGKGSKLSNTFDVYYGYYDLD